MPTYQYACTVASCGHQFDTVQAFSDNALTECPECAGRLRKVWGSIGVVFKGSGFYRNDSRESSKNGKNGTKESAESTSGGDKAPSDSSANGTSAKATGESGPKASPAAKSDSATSSKSTRSPAPAAS